MTPARSLYIHTPFCVQKCPYCDFYKVARPTADAQPGQAWLRALRAEAEQWRHTAGPLRTIFVGGGTPSALTLAELERLLAIVHDHFDLGTLEEFSVEANPNSLTLDKARLLAAGGVNRISVGGQSFDEEVLRFLGRAHQAAEIPRALEHAHAAGIDNVSLDLIAAVGPASGAEEPQRTRRDLEAALALGQSLRHISVYTLVIEPGTPFWTRTQRGEELAPDEAIEAECYRLIAETLTDAGFTQYEVSNYARQANDRCRHNLAYWRCEPYLGLGPSAHSYDTRRRRANARDLRRYIEAYDPKSAAVSATATTATAATAYEEETLTAEQLVTEHLMMGLRLNEGVNLEALSQEAATLAQQTGEPPHPWQTLSKSLAPTVVHHINEGRLTWQPPNLQVTKQGFAFVDRIVLDLLSKLDTHHPRNQPT